MQPLGDEIDDPIKPVQITHGIDEVWVNGELAQFYNFLDYRFEADGLIIEARAYADNFEEVDFEGPFRGETELTPIEAPKFVAAVEAYLQRRFRTVTRS